MTRRRRRPLALSFALLVALPTLPLAGQARPASSAQGATAPAPVAPSPEIVVAGTGEIRARPDRASLEVAVESRARNAADAGTENARRVRAVLDTLRRMGYDSAHVATVGYALQPDWRAEGEGINPRRKQVGYVVYNTVRVRVEQIDRLGATVDAALAAGANRIGSIQYSISTQSALQLAALDSAVAQARRRATTLARAAGGALGPLVQLSTERNDAQPGVREAMYIAAVRTVAPSENTPIDPGEMVVSATVVGRWRFVPPVDGGP